MLTCIGEIACLVFGIIVVATGKMSISSRKEVRGVPARIAGVLLILPLPIALLIGVMIGVVFAARGQEMRIGQAPLWLAFVELGILLVCITAAFLVAGLNAQPIEKRRPVYHPEADDDYADDDLRRPRPRGQDYDEPPPPDDRLAR